MNDTYMKVKEVRRDITTLRWKLCECVLKFSGVRVTQLLGAVNDLSRASDQIGKWLEEQEETDER